MEGADAKFLDFQASSKFFFDSASQCFDHCIKSFDAKELSAPEKNCVNQCFTKQMVVYGNFVNDLSQTGKK